MRSLSLLVLLLLPQEKPEWKRLEEALRPPDQRKHEITAWPYMRTLADLSSPQAPALLERFSENPKELGLASPVERAVFQRLLWAFFDGQHRSWKTVAPNPRGEPTAVKGAPVQKKPERMLEMSARLIRRLALSEDEIRALPDPFARTLESKVYPTSFDPSKPDQPFLPADLWNDDGPWISLGNSSELPLAIRHVGYFGGRSSFHIFLRVPEGRAAGLDLARALRSYKGDRPLDAPKLPPGTQVALVEQSFLISAANQVVASPLTEIVEFRVILKPEARFDSTRHKDAQAIFRFRLRPDLLASGDPAPLRARGTDKEDWEPISLLVEQGRAGPWTTGSSSLFLCASCHTFSQAQTLGIFELRQKEEATLEVVAPAKERARILRWKEKDEAWKELQSYWK